MPDTEERKMDEKPWQKAAPSFLILYSVLAALSGILLSIVLAENNRLSGAWWIPGISLSLAVFLFILSAEKITDALDEKDVKKYVSWDIPYNFAVMLLIFGLITVVFFRYNLSILNPILAFYAGYQFPCSCIGKTIDILWIFIIFTSKWWRDTRWLLATPEREYLKYIEELEGERTPEPDTGLLYERFIKIRGLVGNVRKHINKEAQPDFKDVRLELHPSKVDGVGVFAARQIKKGEWVAEGLQAEDYSSLVLWERSYNLDKTLQEKICDFCIGTPEGFYPPDDYDFNKLSIEWFMNHSCDGNVGFDEKGNFVAIKEIETGDEVTYDYALAESNPRFIMKCKCGNKNCRSIVTGDDWKDENFRKRNLKHTLPSLRLIFTRNR